MAHPILSSKRFGYQFFESLLGFDSSEKKKAYILAAFNGDFWQDGTKTLLPTFAATPGGISAMASFKQRYVSRNVLKEGVETVSGVFLSKMPQLSFVIDNEQISLEKLKLKIASAESGDDDDSELLDETAKENKKYLKFKPIIKVFEDMQKIFESFWAQSGMAEELIKSFENRLVIGRGGARILIQDKFKDKNKFVSADTLLKALKHILIENVDVESGRAFNDGGELFSIVKYKYKDDWDKDGDSSFIEFSFVDDEMQTFIGRVKQGDAVSTLESVEDISDALDFNGETNYFEMTGKPYITEQIFQNNMLVNLNLTCLGFNTIDNGFGETITTNVDVEMERVTDPESETGYREIPKKLKRSGGVINNLVGLSEYSTDGSETITSPGVHFRDPSPATAFVDGKKVAYTACLEELQQLHRLITGDAVASGVSRVQALSDFWSKIKRYKPEIDSLLSWAFTGLAKLIISITDDPEVNKIGKLEGFSIMAATNVKLAVLTAEEKQEIRDMVKDGLISYQTGRVLLEIDNPNLEKELIAKEQAERQQKLDVIAEKESEKDPENKDPENDNDPESKKDDKKVVEK